MTLVLQQQILPDSVRILMTPLELSEKTKFPTKDMATGDAVESLPTEGLAKCVDWSRQITDFITLQASDCDTIANTWPSISKAQPV